jgi:outer membrane protein OmpA-like peptidoglycan-associated protein
MKAFLATTCIVTGALLAGGCATKKYVRNTTAPIQAKVDQVGEQTTRNSTQLGETRDQLKQVDEKAQSGISAAQEKASSADQHAAAADQHAATADQHAQDAMTRATQAQQSADNTMNTLRSVVANIDDYKLQTSATVPFQFNKYTLTPDGKEGLDKLADQVKADKRYFIAVEGYTDNTGTKEYNEALSQRRADTVRHYLVTEMNVPIYRIHMIGLGQLKPVDEATNRAARAKNRRVEVKVFTADPAAGSSLGTSSPAAPASDRSQSQVVPPVIH